MANCPLWNKTQDKLISTKKIAPYVYYCHVADPQWSDETFLFEAKEYFGMYDLEECMKLRSSAAIRHHLISRIALKNAVCAFVREKNNDILLPKDFFCTHDERGCPLIKSCGYMTRRTDNLHVSLSHKDYRAAAIVSDIPVGIDLEKIEQKSEEFIRIAYTEQERARLRFLDTQDAVIRFWVAKEACAKKTGLGLQGQPQAFEVIAIDGDVLTIGETRVKTLKVEKDYIVGWTI